MRAAHDDDSPDHHRFGERRLRRVATRLAALPWVRAARRRYDRQLRFLARRLSPRYTLGLWLTLGVVALAVFGWAFFEVLDAVTERDEVAALDSPTTRWLVAHRVPWLTTAMRAVTELGSAHVVIPVLLVVTVVLARHATRWRERVLPVLSAAGTALIVTGVKLLIARPRPDVGEIVATANGFSFPSGHSAQAVATYGALAWIAARALRRRASQVLAWLAAALVILLIGCSRLYLGVHWLSDVLGGYALGGAWLVLALTATATYGRVRDARGVAGAPSRPPDRGASDT